MDKKYISLKDAAELLGFSTNTLYHKTSCRPPKIPHYKVDGKILFSVAELEAFLESKHRPAI